MLGKISPIGNENGATRDGRILRVLLVLALAGNTLAGPEPGTSPAAGADGDSLAKVADPELNPTFPDVRVRDQDGRELRFYSDLVKDRVVVLNFIFTSCRTICPPLGASFGKLQEELERRGWTDRVSLISVSVDPVTDTPKRLKTWAQQFGAGPGWFLVTGKKTDVDDLLKAANAFTADKWDHAPILLMGNDATGRWTRTYGLAQPQQIADLLKEFLTEPGNPQKEAEL